MAGLSTDQEDRVLKALVNEAAYVNSTAFWVELNTADPTDTAATADGNSTDQTAGAQQVTSWAAVSAGATSNGNALSFDMTGATPGTATHFSVWSHQTNRTATDYLGSGALASSEAFTGTSTIQFGIGDLDWTID